MTRRYSHIQMQSKLAAVRALLGTQPQGSRPEKAQATRKKKRSSYLRIMISCPVANKLGHTGIATEEKAFRDGTTYASPLPAECRQIHSRTKNDALLLA
jgi:hypothetical protein